MCFWLILTTEDYVAWLNLQKMHPGKVWLTRWHRTSVAFKTVIVSIIIVPKRAANVDGIVADGKLQSTANGDALRQIESKRESVRSAVSWVQDVTGYKVVEYDPLVGCVTNGHLFAVTQVGNTNDARHCAVLFTNKASVKTYRQD